jgi:hypothetical protein
MRRQRGRGGFEGRDALAVERPQPAVRRPFHWLNRGLATERAPSAVVQWTTAEIDHVGLAGLCFDEIGVTSALERSVGTMTRAHNIDIRMKLVGTR